MSNLVIGSPNLLIIIFNFCDAEQGDQDFGMGVRPPVAPRTGGPDPLWPPDTTRAGGPRFWQGGRPPVPPRTGGPTPCGPPTLPEQGGQDFGRGARLPCPPARYGPDLSGVVHRVPEQLNIKAVTAPTTHHNLDNVWFPMYDTLH